MASSFCHTLRLQSAGLPVFHQFLLVLLLLSGQAGAQEPLSLSVARFWGPDIVAREQYLLDSLALAIYRELATAPPVIFTDSLRRAVAAERAEEHLAAISAARREAREREALSDLGIPRRGNPRAVPNAPDLGVPRNLSFSLDGEETRPLLALDADPSRGGPREIRTLLAALDTDLLVAGTLEALDDYFILDVYLLSGPDGGRRLILSIDARADELAVVLDAAIGSLVNALSGNSYASLSITGIDPGTELLLDGESAGFGPGIRRYLQPGPVQVSLRYPDTVRRVTRVELAPGALQTQDLSERPEGDQTLTFSSQPPGAEVLVNSQPLGPTPLSLPPPLAPSVAVVARSGFYNAWIPLDAGQRGQTDLRLRPLSDGVESSRVLARNRFYRSFALFSASLVLPIASQAAFDQRRAFLLGGVGNDEFNARQFSIARGLQVSTALGTAGSVAAGALLVVRLLDFLRSSEDAFHTR